MPAPTPDLDHTEFLRECAAILGKLEAALERGDIHALVICALVSDGSEDYIAVRPTHSEAQQLLGAVHCLAYRLTAWIEQNTVHTQRGSRE